MDELLMGIHNTFHSSTADSATMSILHSAMIKAHEKVRSKKGVIERLNEQSKFCELAIVQLEACMKLVEEEAGNYLLENKYHRLLPDMTQIKNRLYVRLKETETAISDKDKELVERAKKERRLKQALEAKEKEIQSLRNSCKDSNNNNERKEGDFCELKNTVDQQVLSIKQHLEGEKMALTRRLSQGSSVLDSELLDVIKDHQSGDVSPVKGDNGSNFEQEGGNFEMGFDQIGLEIDKLKHTTDTAFGMMQSAISGFDDHPLEMQLMCKIENEMQSILFKEFKVDIEEKFHAKVQPRFLNVEQWSELVHELTQLRGELESLICTDDCGSKSDKMEELVMREKEVKRHTDEDSEEGSPSKVALMIETHEKIIGKKGEELNWMKAMEMVREKGPLSPRRSKIIVDSLKKSVNKVINKVDEFLKWKGKVDELPNKEEVTYESEMKEKHDENEISMIKQQIEDLSLQFLVTEEIYICFLISLMRDSRMKFDEYDIRISVNEGILWPVFKQVVKDLRLCMEKNVKNYSNFLGDYELMFNLKEDIMWLVFRETMEDSSKTLSEVNESKLRLCQFLKEMKDSLAQEFENYRLENMIKEDINQCIFLENVKDYHNVKSAENDHIKLHNLQSSNEDQSHSFTLEDDKEVSVAPHNSQVWDNINGQEKPALDSELASSLLILNQVIVNFEDLLQQKLDITNLRLQKVNDELKPLIGHTNFLKKNESLYKEAFVRRCQNLQKAETEVDILGDQVEVLTSLLEKIYSTLHYYTPVLQHFTGVMDILIWIKKELNMI